MIVVLSVAGGQGSGALIECLRLRRVHFPWGEDGLTVLLLLPGRCMGNRSHKPSAAPAWYWGQWTLPVHVLEETGLISNPALECLKRLGMEPVCVDAPLESLDALQLWRRLAGQVRPLYEVLVRAYDIVEDLKWVERLGRQLEEADRALSSRCATGMDSKRPCEPTKAALRPSEPLPMYLSDPETAFS
ncbi:MAG TPA: hypothetical protein PKJ98_11455 [Verrucomicrobiota bacterium]|nr:hypothetical protein [Verrucomicrobiota bacterium]